VARAISASIGSRFRINPALASDFRTKFSLPISVFAVGYVLFAMDLEKAFQLSGATLASKIILMIAAFHFFLTRRRTTSGVIAASVAVIVVITSALFTSFPGFTWEVFFPSLNQIITPFAFLAALPREQDSRSMLVVLAVTPIISVIGGAVYQLLGVGSVMIGAGAEMRLCGTTLASYLAGMALSGTVAALLYTRNYNKRAAPLIMVNGLILLMTGGRTPLAVAIIVSTYSIIFDVRSPLRTVKLVPVLIAAVAAVIVFGDTLFKHLFSTGMSGRDILWAYFDNLREQYPVFGIGLGHGFISVPHSVTVLVGGTAAAHNEYVRLSTEIGTVQTVILFGCFLLAVSGFRRHTAADLRFMPLVTLVAFLMLCATDNAISTPSYYPLLLLSACAIKFRHTVLRRTPRGARKIQRPFSHATQDSAL
jgi:hypothetical protein